eukprot:c20656_g1_i1.p1 GENE.c20656_g1_i1~~c20656_g1_i1.p1  ORF type:complete len:825 (-),score=252.08 c20656_g1_i1:44-2518(-)
MTAVVVRNIVWKATEEQFKEAVKDLDGLTSVDFKTEGGKPKGLADLVFSSEDAASKAVQELNGRDFLGRALQARLDRPNTVRQTVAPSEADLEVVRKTASLFVANVPPSVTRDELSEFFEQRGEVKEVTILTDKETNKSKGAAFVTFADGDLAVRVFTYPKAFVIQGRTLRLLPRTGETSPRPPPGPSPTEVHVWGPLSLGETEFRKLFETFGECRVRVLKPRQTSYAIIRYATAEQAAHAIQQTNGLEISGGSLRASATAQRSEGEAKPNQRRGGPRDNSNNANGNQNAQKEKSNADEAVAASKIAHSRHEAALLRFFEGYVKEPKSEDAWVEMKKGQNVQRELQKQSELRSISLKDLVQQLEAGSSLLNAQTRAELLTMWSTLLAKEGLRFRDASQQYVTFREAFVSSRAIENLALGAFSMPIATPIEKTAPNGVEEVLLQIFDQVLIGSHKTHRHLLDTIKLLEPLSENVTPQLRAAIADLFACFKKGRQGDVEGGTEAMVAHIVAEVQAEPAPNPSVIERFDAKWRAVLKVAGLGGMSDVAGVYHRLETNLRELHDTLTAQITSISQEIDQLESDVKRLNETSQTELSETTRALTSVTGKIKGLTDKKNTLKSTFETILNQLDQVSAQYAALVKSKKETVSTHNPIVERLERAKSTAVAALHAEENKKQILDKTGTVLDHAHTFLCARVKEGNGGVDKSSLGDLTHKSLNAANLQLSFVLEEMLVLKKKANFCSTKVASMRLEQQEMEARDLVDVASKYTAGIEKMVAQLESIQKEMGAKLLEANRIFVWLSTLTDTGLIPESETSKITPLYRQIESLKV